jgi:exodeoxyribonuclease VII small subunit
VTNIEPDTAFNVHPTEQKGGPSANPDIAALPFDAALAELQAVVGRLEAGGLQLEESIALYERGVALHQHCSTLLTGAELRVQRLVEGAGGSLRTIDLRPDDEA